MNLILNGDKLCRIIRSNPKNISELKQIHGLGDKIIAQYGEEIINTIHPPNPVFETEIEEIQIKAELPPIVIPAPVVPAVMSPKKTKEIVAKSKSKNKKF